MLLARYRDVFAVGWFGIGKAEVLGVHHGAVDLPSACHFRVLGPSRTWLHLKGIHPLSGGMFTRHCAAAMLDARLVRLQHQNNLSGLAGARQSHRRVVAFRLHYPHLGNLGCTMFGYTRRNKQKVQAWLLGSQY
jgi:hypothetical protein